MASSLGFEIIPRETINVVALAGGWLTSRRTMNAPVAESERAAASTLGQKIPGCSPNRKCAGAADSKCRITADEANNMANDSISRTRSPSKRDKEQKICRGSERGEDKGVPSHERENR